MTTVDQTRPSTTENDFDADNMREKYRRERDKRIRADGNDQYIEVTGDFAHFVDDPYVQSGYEREPVFDDIDVLLIGGGAQTLLQNVLQTPLLSRRVPASL